MSANVFSHRRIRSGRAAGERTGVTGARFALGAAGAALGAAWHLLVAGALLAAPPSSAEPRGHWAADLFSLISILVFISLSFPA